MSSAHISRCASIITRDESPASPNKNNTTTRKDESSNPSEDSNSNASADESFAINDLFALHETVQSNARETRCQALLADNAASADLAQSIALEEVLAAEAEAALVTTAEELQSKKKGSAQPSSTNANVGRKMSKKQRRRAAFLQRTAPALKLSSVREKGEVYVLATAIVNAAVNVVAKRSGVQSDEGEVLADMEVQIKGCGLSRAQKAVVREVLGEVRCGVLERR